MTRIKLDNGRYLIAVSGGPDSMALLDMANKNDCYIEVAHVNYHKRKSAIDDEKIVRRYCRKHKIRFHRLDANDKNIKGNFQQYARNLRYVYFCQLCKKYKLDKVLVAHHKDDLLETYLMQKNKNLGVDYYGLKKEIVINGIDVYRPLLKYSKDELIEYCRKHNIEYGIDESNLKNDYTRNKIRHNIVEKMTDKQKDKLIKEIDDKNKIKKLEERKLIKYLKKNSFTFDEFIKIENLKGYLRHQFPHKSKAHYNEMIRQLKSTDTYVYEANGLILTKEYGLVNIFDRPQDYEYVFNDFDELKYKKYRYFEIKKKADSFHSVTITDKDFPITIRNYQKGDSIRMNYGTKKINRFFIDNKVLLYDRLTYPIVLDKNGTAILVPKIGCDRLHYSKNPNLYVIKL